ncbi:MAG: SufB/SufD family protein [Candidatus Limnocylindrales bacterium]
MTVERAARPARIERAGATERRGLADLPFRFADRALIESIVTERGEPGWLKAERLGAFEAFDALATEPNRLYTPYIDLRPAELMDVRPYLQTAAASSATASSAEQAPPDDADGLIELREDGVTALGLSDAARTAGVVLETLGGALARDPAGTRELLEDRLGLPTNDKFAQLSRAFWTQGIVLRVPAGVRLEKPIVLRWLVGVPDRALLTRTIVQLGEDAGASLLEELSPAGPEIACAAGETVPQALFTGTMELHLDRGSNLSVASIQDLGPRQIAFQHRHASIGPSANLQWALAQLGGRLVRSRVDNRLVGDGSGVEQVEIVFGSDSQLFDLTSFTTHLGRNTTGNLLSKGALKDSARAFMKGLITIEKTAVGTDSFLGEFGMNLSKAARAVAIPSLEIDQPDCRRAAHSSSVGPIDETQLFYLESRGIDPDDARKFIVLGFLEPVVARVPMADAQERLRELLEEKWSGPLADVSAA